MLLPVGDDNSDRTIRPYVNYLLIVANILVFVFLQGAGNDLTFTYAFSAVPAEIITGRDFVTPSQIILDPNTGSNLNCPVCRSLRCPCILHSLLLCSCTEAGHTWVETCCISGFLAIILKTGSDTGVICCFMLYVALLLH